jgi:alkylation response protein AidB-like acyl-CoA dehydrogenase
MDFTFTVEQKLLKENVERFIANEYTFNKRRAWAQSEVGFSRENWARFGELGWLGVGVAEEYGGLGGSAVEQTILMEAFGRGLVVEPYVTTAVLGITLLHYGGSPQQKQKFLPAIAAGEALIAFGFAERQSRYNAADVATMAHQNGGGFVLNGTKSVVFNASSADTIIVSVRTAGASRDEHGVSLFLVERQTPGVVLREYATVDSGRAAELSLNDVHVGADAVLGELDAAFPVIERVIDGGIVGICAEAVGIMATLCETTLEYLKTRQQFGRPIGEFQVLQHRMVDMYVACELSRSMAYMAAIKLDDPEVTERRRAVSAAKVQIGRAGRFIGQQAIQLHGAMGMTDELAVGHYFKRLTMIDSTFGDADYHLQRFASLQLSRERF